MKWYRWHIFVLFFLFLRCRPVDSWSSHVHEVIAGIAVLSMNPKEREQLDNVYKEWDVFYPEGSDIISSAPWLDHIRCFESNRFCGAPPYDNLEMFGPFHYINIPYNRTDDPIEGLPRYHPLPNTGSVYILDTILDSLLRTKSEKIHKSPIANQKGFAHVSCEELSDGKGNYFGNGKFNRRIDFKQIQGTALSYNLQLRMLIHIFGDLHQPMHNIEGFWPQYPHGDKGGAKIPIEPHEGSHSVHSFWDEAGLHRFRGSTVLERAQHVMAAIPAKNLKELKNDKCGLEIGPIALDAFALAKEYAYTGLVDETLEVSAEYKRTVQEICVKQIALAGYRLSRVLALVAHTLPNRYTQSTLQA